MKTSLRVEEVSGGGGVRGRGAVMAKRQQRLRLLGSDVGGEGGEKQ